jgi:hypothetical protein
VHALKPCLYKFEPLRSSHVDEALEHHSIEVVPFGRLALKEKLEHA